MFFKGIILSVFVIAASLIGRAQSLPDSVLKIKEVVIETERSEFITTGNNSSKIDSLTKQDFRFNNLSELLSQHSHISIKSYGFSNLATVSSRGSGAGHTAVLWNGFNLQSPTLGVVDFSLIPVGFIDDIKIQYGGSSSLFGSGAIGGTIHLSDSPVFSEGLNIGASSAVGSFSNFTQSLSLKYSAEKFISSIKVFSNSGKNDFSFINNSKFGNPVEKQVNAEVQGYGILQENYFKIKSNQILNFRIWHQDIDRNIPIVMTANSGSSSIKNSFLRISSEWKRIGNKANYFIRAAYFNEPLIYSDPVAEISSRTDYSTYITEFETQLNFFEDQLIDIGINNTYNKAVSEGFDGLKDQNKSSLFIAYNFQGLNNKLKGSLSGRKEIVDGEFVPFVPAIGLEYSLWKQVKLKGNVSKNYRIPTLNDLYWNPGGNPLLQPESGWSQEGTIMLRSLANKTNEMNFTAFNSYINNWIIWLPSRDYWSPENIQAVWSRGLEMSFKCSKEIGSFKFQLSGLYSYVISTNEKTKSVNDNSLNKQLIYVPLYNAHGNFRVSYKSSYINYNHTYTGNRFTSSDNSSIIDKYDLANLTLGQNFKLKKLKCFVNFQINNIWDEAYQVILWQAMPMRYYQFSLGININQPINNK